MSLREVFASFSDRVPTAIFIHGSDFTGAEGYVLDLFRECEDKVVLRKPKVDEVKSLAAWVNLYPSKKFKVIELFDLELVSKEVVNYLLKAVEDSPSYLKWVFYSRTKYLNKALLSRCYVIPVTVNPEKVDVTIFQEIKDYNSAYEWFLKNKEDLSDAAFKESLLGCCDILLQKQTSFAKIHLVQKYKNLIRKESSGYENSFKFLLTQVF